MQDCDPALLRRFSRRIEVPLPAVEDRRAFFQSVLQQPEIDAVLSQDELQQLAEQTAGYSGSDLAAVCRLAAMAPVRELFQQQRQQRVRRKRRRLCKQQEQHTPDAIQGPQEVLQDLSRGCFDGTVAQAGQTQQPDPSDQVSNQALLQQQPSEGCAVASEQLHVRQLTYADFQTALQKGKPAAVDARVGT
eukprot:GHUV01026845.1.p3 GENE.GHUV01026845.1~~GHUV01026845.1.p3  ORF type:complete len:190 (+),score=82.91 GHUV01026845.1:2716-3285(+)